MEGTEAKSSGFLSHAPRVEGMPLRVRDLRADLILRSNASWATGGALDHGAAGAKPHRARELSECSHCRSRRGCAREGQQSNHAVAQPRHNQSALTLVRHSPSHRSQRSLKLRCPDSSRLARFVIEGFPHHARPHHAKHVVSIRSGI